MRKQGFADKMHIQPPEKVIIRKLVVSGVRNEQDNRIRKQFVRALKHIYFKDHKRDSLDQI
jgi:hypothetical protein